MARELKNPERLHRPPGYSQVAIATGLRLVFIAGQVALDREFRIVGAGDVREQTCYAMRNLEVALREVGATWDDVVKRTIYTLHPDRVADITGAVEEVTGRSTQPAQTIVGVRGLALEGLLVEIDAIASV